MMTTPPATTAHAPAGPSPTDGGATRPLSRRRFLQGTGAALGGLAMTPWLETLMANAAPPLGARDGIVVLVELEGGNDGLNMIPPVGLGGYYDARPTLAVRPNQALPIGSDISALHPSLVQLKRRYDRGKVAIVRGVGYQPPDFSHFTSMAYVMQGWGGPGLGPASGWLGRYLDGLRSAGTEPMYGITMGWRVPLALQGRASRPAALPLDLGNAFGVDRTDTSANRLIGAVGGFADEATGLGRWGDAIARAHRNIIDVGTRVIPAYDDAGLPSSDDEIERQLTLVARLINMNLGIRVLHVTLSGFDTHTSQATTHANLLAHLDAGIDAFFNTIAPGWRDQTIMMVFSEFGRRPEENGDRGTDHGTSGPVLLIGDPIKGGLYGRQPRLAPSALKWWGNLAVEVDHRQIYATILREWLRADAKSILGARFDRLPLLRYTL